MKLEDTTEAYQAATAKASDVSRQLALAALAVVWIFKVDRKGPTTTTAVIPISLMWPALLAIATLAFDLLQYIYHSLAWGVFNRKMEKKLDLDPEKEFDAPRWINWPAIVCFWLKVASVISCYLLLLTYLAHALLN